jgi:hypothetical protein
VSNCVESNPEGQKCQEHLNLGMTSLGEAVAGTIVKTRNNTIRHFVKIPVW